MKCSHLKVSKRIYINLRLIDQSRQNGWWAVHSSIVYGTPIWFWFEIDLNRNCVLPFVEEMIKLFYLVIYNGRQELFLNFCVLFPMILPYCLFDWKSVTFPSFICIDPLIQITQSNGMASIWGWHLIFYNLLKWFLVAWVDYFSLISVNNQVLALLYGVFFKLLFHQIMIICQKALIELSNGGLRLRS